MCGTLLDVIYEVYNVELNDREERKIQAIEDFRKEYVDSAFRQDSKAGMKIEAMFNRALAESDAQAFKDGFKACMLFMMECLST